jgi:hypothetical protein
VTGQVQHLKGPVTEVDDVALGEQPGGGSRGYLADGLREATGRNGVDEQRSDVVAGGAIRPEHVVVVVRHID